MLVLAMSSETAKPRTDICNRRSGDIMRGNIGDCALQKRYICIKMISRGYREKNTNDSYIDKQC